MFTREGRRREPQLTTTLPKIENGMQRVRGWSRNSAGSTIVSQACVHATYIVDSSWNGNDHLAVVIVTPSCTFQRNRVQQEEAKDSYFEFNRCFVDRSYGMDQTRCWLNPYHQASSPLVVSQTTLRPKHLRFVSFLFR
ncbi:hypothetical protein M0802_004519 [Mischocyttarus mexicanus]|nr:hypothetical protein M0802_004519 [Mischocyttarus mexicanus]